MVGSQVDKIHEDTHMHTYTYGSLFLPAHFIYKEEDNCEGKKYKGE